MRVGGWVVILGVVLAGDATGDETRRGDRQTAPAAKEQTEEPPKLSLPTIYRPADQYDYDGKLPKTRWLKTGNAADPGEILLVKREAGWQEVDVTSGMESAWPPAAKIVDRIAAIDGVSSKQAAGAVDRVIESIDGVDQTALVRIGKTLATVSTRTPAKLLTRDASKWNDASLDPSGSRLAYTSEGDLFVIDLASGRSHRLTDDGSPTLLDGRLDWTYQEEIFGRGNYRGFRFSPDGRWLAMLRIDISDIAPYTLGDSAADRGAGLVRRYSKAGDPIPHAGLYLWDLRNLDQGQWPTPRLLVQSTDENPLIVTGMWWHEHSMKFIYTLSNRLQTWRELRYVDQDFLMNGSTNQKRWLREDSPAWVEPPVAPAFLRDGGLIWRSNLPSGRSQLYRLRANAKTVTPITPNDFDVRSFFADPEGAVVLVTGDAEGGTVEQHLYRVVANSDTSEPPGLQRLTEASGWHAVTPSPSRASALIRHSTANQPPKLSVKSTQTPPAGTNQALMLAETERRVPGGWIDREYFRIESPDGFSLPGSIKRSPEATPESPGPVVIEVYGGPGISIVRNQWRGKRDLYHELLARDGISVLAVDNRSSGGRGLADTWSVRGKLGATEFADVKAAVEWLTDQPWVDPDRIAIRGWSFGGFMTLYSMIHSDAFVAGIAGGSVTDWREYDSFYTERYMGLPDANEAGYREHSLLDKAERLHGRVLLIHGELDDNVHPSNTLRMAGALQRAGIQFDLMLYPGSAHAISNPAQSWHLAKMTDEFLYRHLLGKSGDIREP